MPTRSRGVQRACDLYVKSYMYHQGPGDFPYHKYLPGTLDIRMIDVTVNT